MTAEQSQALGAPESGAPAGPGTLSLSKAELLGAVERLCALARGYGGLLDQLSTADASREAAVSHFLAERERMAQNGLPDSRAGLVMALARHLLRRVEQDPLRFNLPSRAAWRGFAARENPKLLDYSNRLREHSGPVEARVAPVNALAEQAEAEGSEHQAALLSAVASLFKAMLRQDWRDVELLLSLINLTTSTRERHELVRQIARIARDIYNSLHAFSEEVSLQGLSSTMPDAVGRLRSVIEHLEQAANANLDALERLGRENEDNRQWLEEAQAVARACDAEYARLAAEHPGVAAGLNEAGALMRERIAPLLEGLRADYQASRDGILAMVASQSFQDLTGQTLEKVIHLVETLQFQLIELLKRHTGDRAPPAPPAPPAATQEPAAPPVRQTQEEVDKLLTELGF